MRLDDEAGATSAEYALVAALIAVVIVGAVTALGLNLNDLFSNADLRDALTN
ncbi:MAG: Flp family type IVb pilin [Actinomycetota bacterium]|nr:Flp family type IVb pilin [Actinomycetota bacterium]